MTDDDSFLNEIIEINKSGAFVLITFSTSSIACLQNLVLQFCAMGRTGLLSEDVRKKEPSSLPIKENRYLTGSEHRKYWSDIIICGFDFF